MPSRLHERFAICGIFILLPTCSRHLETKYRGDHILNNMRHPDNSYAVSAKFTVIENGYNPQQSTIITFSESYEYIIKASLRSFGG